MNGISRFERLSAATHALFLKALIPVSKWHDPTPLCALPNSEILAPPYSVPDRGHLRLKVLQCYGMKNKNSFTVFAFQFEEQFLQSPEDLEKLRKGKTKYLICSHEGVCKVIVRFEHQATPACVYGGSWGGGGEEGKRFQWKGRAP